MTQSTPEPSDGRLSWHQAIKGIETGRIEAAFAATPVFGDEGDENETAEGVRIFLLLPGEDGDVQLRFIAGPFFSAAYAANETLDADEAPESVRELRYLITRCEESWLSDQVQILLQRLIKAAGIGDERLPNYAAQPLHGAGPDAVFPISFIGQKEIH